MKINYDRITNAIIPAPAQLTLRITTSVSFFLKVFTANFSGEPMLGKICKLVRNSTVQQNLSCCLQFIKFIEAPTLQSFLEIKHAINIFQIPTLSNVDISHIQYYLDSFC